MLEISPLAFGEGTGVRLKMEMLQQISKSISMSYCFKRNLKRNLTCVIILVKQSQVRKGNKK
jgi:hypothetical protein